MNRALDPDDFVIYNKTKSLTTDELYNVVYQNQFLEILKLAIGFAVSKLFIDLIDSILLNNYKNNKFLYSFLLVLIIVSFILLGSELFTYLKIENDKDTLLKQYSFYD